MKVRLLCFLWFCSVSALHAQTNSPPDIKVFFSPHGGCTEAVVDAIREARKQILVEAYAFTSRQIVEALIDAKRRGVNVEGLLDKSQSEVRESDADMITKGGIPLFTMEGEEIRSVHRAGSFTNHAPRGHLAKEPRHGIAHNKVMIIDDAKVITGSFNFTRSAEEYNFENLLVISNDPPLANAYTAMWKRYQAQSEPYQPGIRPRSFPKFWMPF